jgi:putative transposase
MLNVRKPIGRSGNSLIRGRAKRDKAAARRYFEKAIAANGVPETVTIDRSGTNLAGLNAINADSERTDVE